LIERKGIDVLIEAWQRIHDSYPQAHLLLVGKDRFPDDTAAEQYLTEQLDTLSEGAVENLHRVGVVDDVEAYLQVSDVFLFPSRREGFGTVMVEAMACGLPSVVAEMPGITDTIFSDDAGDGIVVPQEDPAALARAAELLLADPGRARSVGQAARQRAVQAFSMERIADSYAELYSDLLNRGRT
jgi:glycosyltransferase involved in cell wall biosynthesis